MEGCRVQGPLIGRRIDVDQYSYGLETAYIESDRPRMGYRKDYPSASSLRKKNEPAWMLEVAAGTYRRGLTMTEPKWALVH